MPWRRTRQPTPVYLPGESHGQRSLAGYGHRVPKGWTRLKGPGVHARTRRQVSPGQLAVLNTPAWPPGNTTGLSCSQVPLCALEVSPALLSSLLTSCSWRGLSAISCGLCSCGQSLCPWEGIQALPAGWGCVVGWSQCFRSPAPPVTTVHWGQRSRGPSGCGLGAGPSRTGPGPGVRLSAEVMVLCNPGPWLPQLGLSSSSVPSRVGTGL